MSNRCWFAIIRGTTYFMLKGSASWQGKEATNVIVVNKPDPLGDKVLAHNEVSILDLYDSDPILLMLLMGLVAFLSLRCMTC